MARIKIDLPGKWLFSLDLPVRITDINYGRHLGNDSMLALIQEARVRWLQQFGWTEMIAEPVGLTMIDVAVRFKGEAVFGDTLRIQLAPVEWAKLGFELVYLVTKVAGGAEVARAKTGFVFFDYAAHRIAPMPPEFRATVEGGPKVA